MSAYISYLQFLRILDINKTHASDVVVVGRDGRDRVPVFLQL